jgi:polysaccharide biosynthesis transport protein
VQLFVRRRLVFLGAVLLSILVFVGATFWMTPEYRATAKVQIDSASSAVVDLNQPQRVQAPDPSFIETEVQVLRSRDLVEAVVDRLGLAKGQDKDMAVRDLQENLAVQRSGTANIVDVSVRSKNAAQAARLANAVTDTYLARTVSSRVEQAVGRSGRLQQRLAALGREVQAADSRLAEYQARTGIVRGGSLGTITDQQVAPLSSQLATAESEAAAARAALAAAQRRRSSGQAGSVENVLSSPVIADLRRQRAEVARNQADLVSRYGPKHPTTLRIADQLQALDQQIADESQRIIAGLSGTAETASARAESLRSELSRIRGEQASNTRASAVAEGLERDAQAKRASYEQLAAIAQRVNQQERLSEPVGQIAQRAAEPDGPVSPNRPVFGAVGLVFGIILGIVAVLAAEALFPHFASRDDVENTLGLRMLASIPRLSKGPSNLADEVIGKPLGRHAELVRRIRGALPEKGRAGRGQVVLISSSLPGEGKTSLATALGRIIAEGGERVILLDCDLRRGQSTQMLGITGVSAGLPQLLAGDAALDAAMRADPRSSLMVLPATATNLPGSNLFAGAALRDLVDDLRTRFDRIIIDTPPVLSLEDTKTLARVAVAIIFAVRAYVTPKRAAQLAVEMLEGTDAPVIGSVLTMTNPRSRWLNGGDPAAYYSRYASYYS